MPDKNSKHLDALKHVPTKVKEYNFKGLAGCVMQRKSRESGTIVSVYRNDQAGINVDCLEPWSTVCETHGNLVAHDTLTLAIYHLANPCGWCETCMENAASK